MERSDRQPPAPRSCAYQGASSWPARSTSCGSPPSVPRVGVPAVGEGWEAERRGCGRAAGSAFGTRVRGKGEGGATRERGWTRRSGE
eukprot:scaffold31978_cov30-Tisochrysis_lutea.AAC.3